MNAVTVDYNDCCSEICGVCVCVCVCAGQTRAAGGSVDSTWPKEDGDQEGVRTHRCGQSQSGLNMHIYNQTTLELHNTDGTTHIPV